MASFYTNFALHMGKVLLREVVDGVHREARIPIRPYLFVTDPAGDYSTVYGERVSKRNFSSTTEARKFVETYGDVSNFRIYGSTSWAYPFINDYYPGEVEFDSSQICVAYIDLEVRSDSGFPEPSVADKEITAIALSVSGKMHVFSTVDYVPEDGVAYVKCHDEENLLLNFLTTWRGYKIDVLVGWNIDQFDAPYLINRIRRVLDVDPNKPSMANSLSPWNILNSRTAFSNNREYVAWTIVGITIVDYMEAYKKFTHKPQESYSLNNISHVELKEKKLDYSEYTSLHDMYVRDPQKFIEYNIKDVRLIERLDQKLGLLNLIFNIAYYCKITYDDAFGTVKMWETLIHNELMKRRMVVPHRRSDNIKTQFEGGYVKDVQEGKHDWVVSFDFDSLYPHLIMALNISPETITGTIPRMTVDEILDGGFDRYRREIGEDAVTGSCHKYSRKAQGFFPRLMEDLYVRRQENKDRADAIKKRLNNDKSLTPEERDSLTSERNRYHNLQLAMKYALNSGYGAMSNEYFLWFDMRMAESVTLSGQVAIRWVARDINAFMRKVCGIEQDFIIAIDTDSAYVNLGPLVRKVYGDKLPSPEEVTEFIDRVCKTKILGVIRDSCVGWGRYMNAYDLDKLKMKREKIAETGIWTAKKKYALLVWDDEGTRLSEPEMKFTGLEVVKSSTPAVCRVKMKEAIRIMLSGTEEQLQNFVADFKKEFMLMPFEDVASPRGVNNIHTYVDANGNYESGVPLHTRGAIVYNRLLEEMGLTNSYVRIQSGDKIKYCYMKMPNPMHENVISCPTVLPKELGLNAYVDYELQFDKTFAQPIRLLLNTIGWSDVKRFSLAGFFS